MKKILPYMMPIFRSGLFIVGGLVFAFITNQSLVETSKYWSVLCTVFNVVTIIVIVLVCRYEGITYWSLIDYKKGQLGFKNTVTIVLLMLTVGIAGMYAFGLFFYGYIPTILIQPIPIWIAAINLALLPITIVFAELPLYFGYSFNRIKENTSNKYLAMVYIIFFYALQHSFIPLSFDLHYALFRFFSFLPLMIVLVIIYNRKRRLDTLMIGHGILDLATGIQILISSVVPEIFAIMQQSTGK